jgi:acetyl esterase/lipase
MPTAHRTEQDMQPPVDRAKLDPADDPAIDRRSRAFLKELNKDSSPFWELPGDQAADDCDRAAGQTPVDLSRIEIDERELGIEGRTIRLQVVRPEGLSGTLPVFIFHHGAVWIASNFENHKRLVRDLVVGSGAVAVFPEYTPVPEASSRCRSVRATPPLSGPVRAARRSGSTPASSPSPAPLSAATWPPP